MPENGETIATPSFWQSIYEFLKDRPILLVAIGVIIVAILVLLIVMQFMEEEIDETQLPRVKPYIRSIEVAPNGIIIDVDGMIRNTGEVPLTLAAVDLHLIEHNQKHVMSVEQVFGGEVPCELEPNEVIDVFFQFISDRALMEEIESEAWITCKVGNTEFESNRIELIL